MIDPSAFFTVVGKMPVPWALSPNIKPTEPSKYKDKEKKKETKLKHGIEKIGAKHKDQKEPKNEEEYFAAWQQLIDTGLAWSLQGWFGRTAIRLIEDGRCTAPKEVLTTP